MSIFVRPFQHTTHLFLLSSKGVLNNLNKLGSLHFVTKDVKNYNETTRLAMKTQMQGNRLKGMPNLLFSEMTFLKYDCFYIADIVLLMRHNYTLICTL